MRASGTIWRWVSSETQHGDGLTKDAERGLLTDRLRSRKVLLVHDPTFPSFQDEDFHCEGLISTKWAAVVRKLLRHETHCLTKQAKPRYNTLHPSNWTQSVFLHLRHQIPLRFVSPSLAATAQTECLLCDDECLQTKMMLVPCFLGMEKNTEESRKRKPST